MADDIRRLRRLLILKLASLAIALLLLATPPVIPMRWPGAWALAGVVLWGFPFVGRAWRTEAFLAALAFLESLWITALVLASGHGGSPFALLLPALLAQAALFLSGPLYLWIAGVAWAGYAVAGGSGPHGPPDMRLMLGLAIVAFAFWFIAWLPKAEMASGAIAKRRYHYLAGLLGHLPGDGPTGDFWERYVTFVRRREGFSSVALLRFELPNWRVHASDRTDAWGKLATRQSAFLRHEVMAQGQSALLIEGAETGRVIACLPIRYAHNGPALGILCALAQAETSLAIAERRLKRWAPLAASVLAAGVPHWRLAPRFIDWRQLLDTTLEKLSKRLTSHLVLLELEPGVVMADALLLSDAIAHVVEEALNRLPAKSQLRLSARRTPGAWHFELASTPPLISDPSAHHPGLLLAKQVITAHGGSWAPVRHPEGLAWGFTLPDALGASPLPIAQPAPSQA